MLLNVVILTFENCLAPQLVAGAPESNVLEQFSQMIIYRYIHVRLSTKCTLTAHLFCTLSANDIVGTVFTLQGLLVQRDS